jgi:CRISPR system Cascade subunit CasC
MTTYITIHHLVSLPVGLANRGADGLAKTAVYGGVTRQRVSSQCVKSHLREHPAITSLANSLSQAMSIRSALIGPRCVAPALQKDGAAEQEAQEIATALMEALFQGEDDGAASKNGGRSKGKNKTQEPDAAQDEDQKQSNDEAKKRQILVLGRAEIEAIVCIGKADEPRASTRRNCVPTSRNRLAN